MNAVVELKNSKIVVCIFWGKYHYARPRLKERDLLQPLCGSHVSDEDKPRLSPLAARLLPHRERLPDVPRHRLAGVGELVRAR